MKPDNFPFSEEIYEKIEAVRKELLDFTSKYSKSPRPAKLDARLFEMSKYVLSPEYDRYMKDNFAKEDIQYSYIHTEAK